VISRLRRVFFENLVLKVTALIIALLMWYGVTHEPIAEIAVRLPIEFANPPKNLDYSTDVVPQAVIRLRGPARLLREVPEDSMHVVVDLSGATPGEHTYDLNTSQVQVPHDIRVMEITPTRVHLVFDVSETRQVAVKPRIVGSLPPGYQLVSIVANPSTLTISGPRRHVDSIENALTDAVDVTGVAGQATFNSRAYLPDPQVHLTGSNSVRITVTTQPMSQQQPPPAHGRRGAR
jgi:YbbR domain-containing protein